MDAKAYLVAVVGAAANLRADGLRARRSHRLRTSGGAGHSGGHGGYHLLDHRDISLLGTALAG